MNITITSKIEDGYLLIEVSGSIADVEQLEELTVRFNDEIAKFGMKKIIIDERKTQFPMSVEHSVKIVEFLSRDLPSHGLG